jgi:hypothetical protein
MFARHNHLNHNALKSLNSFQIRYQGFAVAGRKTVDAGLERRGQRLEPVSNLGEANDDLSAGAIMGHYAG